LQREQGGADIDIHHRNTTWGRLRHLGARREQLLTEAGSQVRQMRALLECVWPAALQTARQPCAPRRGPWR
jgi:hypothetical protein